MLGAVRSPVTDTPFDDVHAAARALGQRGRHAHRVGATFVRDVRRREDVVGR